MKNRLYTPAYTYNLATKRETPCTGFLYITTYAFGVAISEINEKMSSHFAGEIIGHQELLSGFAETVNY